ARDVGSMWFPETTASRSIGSRPNPWKRRELTFGRRSIGSSRKGRKRMRNTLCPSCGGPFRYGRLCTNPHCPDVCSPEELAAYQEREIARADEEIDRRKNERAERKLS
ncbi:MAG: hypothetical protein ACE5D3_02440, partial [Candidatus Binatia bacterium]